MRLEKLLLAASLNLALAGCVTEEVIKKPYRKAKQIPTVNIDTTPIVKREGYETLRLDQGEFEIYDVTVYKPKPNLDLKAQLINELASDYNFYLKEAKREINLEVLASEGTLPISKPFYDAIASLEKSLNSQGSDKSTKALVLCSVSPSTNKIQKRYGYGVRIGANYIIVPASVIYPAIISKEIGEDHYIEFSMLSEHKIAGHGAVHKGQVLAINPIVNIALIETNEKIDTGLFMPIIEEKQLEEAKIFIDRTPLNLTGVFKLTEDQVIWRLTGKEIDLAKSLNYSIATIEKLTNKQGLGVYNNSGLVGLIAQDIRKYLDSEEEFQNSLVIPSSQIRKFLTDYLNFLKSGSNNLEVITKELKKEIKTTEPVTPSIPTTSINPTITQLPVTSESSTTKSPMGIQPIEKEVPIEPITPPFGKLFLIYSTLVLGAGIIGRPYYLKNPPKSKEKPDSHSLPERLSELERWLEYQKYEAKTELRINIPKTILDVKNQETVMGFVEESPLLTEKDIANFQHKFLDWLYTLTPRELPKTYKEHIEKEIKQRKEHAEKETMNLIKTRLDRQKTTIRLIKKDYQIFEDEVAKFEKERAELIERLDKERAERLARILNINQNKKEVKTKEDINKSALDPLLRHLKEEEKK